MILRQRRCERSRRCSGCYRAKIEKDQFYTSCRQTTSPLAWLETAPRKKISSAAGNRRNIKQFSKSPSFSRVFLCKKWAASPRARQGLYCTALSFDFSPALCSSNAGQSKAVACWCEKGVWDMKVSLRWSSLAIWFAS